MDVDNASYSLWVGGTPIGVAFKGLDNFSREVLISGVCNSCQEKTFNTPAPGNEAAFGKNIGECKCCGSPLWEKDVDEEGNVECPCCGCDQDD